MSNDGPPPDPPQPDPGQPDPYGAPPASGQPDPYAAPPAANPYGGSHAATPDQSAPRTSSYGEPAPYGAAPQGSQGAPYVAPPTPQNAYGGGDGSKPTFIFAGYASWGSRVVAYIIDGFLTSLAGFPLWIGYGLLFADATTTTDQYGTTQVHVSYSATNTLLILIGVVTSLIFFVWNQCLRQGRTGATLGKSMMAIRVVHADMQPIGGGLSFVRYLLNIVNGLPCYIGYLWPLWDARNQTFADKIMSTYVIKASEPQPRAH